jgi:hypothetical protein
MSAGVMSLGLPRGLEQMVESFLELLGGKGLQVGY